MRITRNRKKCLLFLSQDGYIKKVLERSNLADAKPLSVPLPPHTKLSKNDCPKDDAIAHAMKGIPYASTCGSLMCMPWLLHDQTLPMQWELLAGLCLILANHIGRE